MFHSWRCGCWHFHGLGESNPIRYLTTRHRDNCATKYGDCVRVLGRWRAGAPHWEQRHLFTILARPGWVSHLILGLTQTHPCLWVLGEGGWWRTVSQGTNRPTYPCQLFCVLISLGRSIDKNNMFIMFLGHLHMRLVWYMTPSNSVPLYTLVFETLRQGFVGLVCLI